jgi:hypothetical protein
LPTAADLLSDPDWFLHRLDAGSGAARFVYLPRDVQRSVTFLSDQYLPKEASRADLPAAELQRRMTASGRLHFLFHSAFCCSTLLARALDVPGRVFSLKEPAALNDLAAGRLAQVPSNRITELLDRALSLYARTKTAGEPIVVKPSNEANNLLELCLKLRPESRAVLMYSPLPAFLRSVAKRGLWGRTWARQLFQTLSPTAPFATGFTAEETFRQSDLQIAGLCWLMHHAQFVRAASQFGARIRTLESTVLLGDPERALLALSDLFGLGLTREDAASIAGGTVFQENSKSMTRGYDRAVRADENAAVDAAHGEEIGMVVTWVRSVAQHCRVPMEMPAPLVHLA